MLANKKRVQAHLEALAQFTATPGKGITRLSYSAEDLQARTYLKSTMQAIGLDVHEDAIGNIYGRLAGQDPTLPAVLIGSHFDSVPHGGAFDGTAGVVMGLEVATLFHEQQLTPYYPLEVVALVEEEGSSFGHGLLASRAIAGQISADDLKQMQDDQGRSAAQKMAQAGFNAEQVSSVMRSPKEMKAFIELHIEQGPILEQAGQDIGIVDTIVGLCQLEITVQGRAGHAGTTPMHLRADALLAATYLIQAINQLAAQETEAVATVGKLAVYPNGSNVIPSKVIFTVDVRAKYADKLQWLLQQIQADCAAANSSTIKVHYHQKVSIAPVNLNPMISALLKANSDKLGFKSRMMVSGAGHDAMVLADLTAVGLVFVPSRQGLSHHPDEWTDYAQICQGIEVIFETVKTLTEEK
ncbi:Zn-dependent hydrolase [Utexia brackfieldae]|uniref:Zn-dependent hydrolase n=1 Tax=Utexia brackfieldae TaxID=3074108 RepID=UPI00370D0E79